MSVLLNFGAAGWQAASSSASTGRKRLAEVMVNEQRREQRGEVRDRETERLLRQRIAVGDVDAYRVENKCRAQRNRGGEVGDAAHPDGERQQRRAEKDDRVEEHLQP